MVNPLDCLAVKIVLLGLVSETPEPPKLNVPLQEHCALNTDRKLSFKHEACIAKQLAFICAYSSDPLHVLAVCVEEAVSRNGMIIRLAFNTGRHEDLIDSLRRITRILQNEATGGACDCLERYSILWLTNQVVNLVKNKGELFTEVLALNRLRILGRLRSRHGHSRGKAPLVQRLQTARRLLSSSMDTVLLGDKIDHLQNDFDCLELMERQQARSSSSDEVLGRLVIGIQSILQLHELDFNSIPETPGVWTGNAASSLIDRLRKACQYVKACEELLRAARRNDIFSDIAVEFVNLQRSEPRLPVGDLATTEELTTVCCSTPTMSRIAVRRETSVSDICQKVRGRLGNIARVHAEIQLVLYYEENPTASCPRVICSSKSACYLCQLFFSIYGQYHIPSTHGKLYDTWNWPKRSQLTEARCSDRTRSKFEDMLPQFSELIDQKILECLESGPYARGVDPVESRVDLSAVMTPSVLSHSSTSVRSRRTRSTTSSTSSVRTPTQLISMSRLSLLGIQEATASDSGHSSSVTVGRITEPVVNSRPQSDRRSQGSSTSGFPLPEIRGQVSTGTQAGLLCLQTGDSRSYSLGLDSLLEINTPELHVDVQHDSHVPDTSPSRQPLLLEVHCLPSLGAEGENDPTYVMDLDESDWVEHTPPDGVLYQPGGFLLKIRSTLLRLRIALS